MPSGAACVCGAEPRVRLLNRGARKPSAAEVEANPRSESARLRAVEAFPPRPGPVWTRPVPTREVSRCEPSRGRTRTPLGPGVGKRRPGGRTGAPGARGRPAPPSAGRPGKPAEDQPTPRCRIRRPRGHRHGVPGPGDAACTDRENQFRLDQLQQQASAQQERYEKLRLEVAELEAPARIVSAAEGPLGMRQPGSVTYLPAPPTTATPLRELRARARTPRPPCRAPLPGTALRPPRSRRVARAPPSPRPRVMPTGL